MKKRSISIICINDFHAEIFESEHTLGAARLSALVSSLMDEHPHSVVVFGGDNYKGDPVSEHLDGVPVTSFMKHLDAKASAVGNHEFEYGLERLRNWSEQGGYPFLAANVIDRQTGRIPEGFEPYTIVTVQGVNIALIGLSTPELLDRSDAPADVRRLEIVNGVEAARRWIDYLQRGEDPRGIPDLVIALTHFGLKYTPGGSDLIGEEVIELCRQVPELAGVFTAHWHQFINVTINGVPVVQGGGNGRGIAMLTIHLSSDHRIVEVVPRYVDGGDRIASIRPDAAMKRLIDEYRRCAMQSLGVIIGTAEEDMFHKSPLTAEVDMEGTPFTHWALEVMRQQTGCPIALLYSGRIGWGLPKGEISLYQLRKLLQFQDEIITMKLRGEELLRNLENGICTLSSESASPIAIGGLYVTADYRRPYRSRIDSVALEDGQPLKPDQYYDVAIDSFLAANEMGYDFSTGKDRKQTGKYLRDCMIRNMQDTGCLNAIYPDNVTVKHKNKLLQAR